MLKLVIVMYAKKLEKLWHKHRKLVSHNLAYDMSSKNLRTKLFNLCSSLRMRHHWTPLTPLPPPKSKIYVWMHVYIHMYKFKTKVTAEEVQEVHIALHLECFHYIFWGILNIKIVMGLPSGGELGREYKTRDFINIPISWYCQKWRMHWHETILGLGGKELNCVLSSFSLTITLKTKAGCLTLKSNYHKWSDWPISCTPDGSVTDTDHFVHCRHGYRYWQVEGICQDTAAAKHTEATKAETTARVLWGWWHWTGDCS